MGQNMSFFRFVSMSAAAVLARFIGALRERRADLEGRALTMPSPSRGADLSGLISAAERILLQLTSMAAQAAAQMNDLGQRRLARGDRYRALQYSHGVSRPAKKSDPLTTAIVLMCVGLIEGVGGSALLIGSGEMDVVPGVALGVIFGGVTVALGVFNGFTCCRYAFFRQRSPVPQAGDPLIRLAARLGFLVCISLQALLIFVAGRVRAMGDHHRPFDFSEVSAIQTFNDGLGITFLILGLLGATYAIFEGFNLTDPVPGLAQARKDAEETTDREAEAAANRAEEGVLDAAEEFLAEAEDKLAEIEEAEAEARAELERLNDDIRDFNNEVEKAKRDYAALISARRQAQECVALKPSAKPLDCKSAEFDALLMALVAEDAIAPDEDQIAQRNELRALIDEVRAALADALADISAAYTDYYASAPDLDISIDLEGGNYA